MEELHGTTTCGIRCKDGIVLATDTRATMGNLIAGTDVKKVYQIDDQIGMTIAGSVGDAQKLVGMSKVEAKLYRMNRKEHITIKALSTLLSRVLNANRKEAYQVSLIVGGKDKNGFNLYSIDAFGGLLEEKKVVSTGSGSVMAYGILDERYKYDMSMEYAKHLAIKAITASIKRDAYSGNSIEIVEITADEWKQSNVLI